MAVSICAAAKSRRARSSEASSSTIGWPARNLSPSHAKIFATRPALPRPPGTHVPLSHLKRSGNRVASIAARCHEERQRKHRHAVHKIGDVYSCEPSLASRIASPILQIPTAPIKQFGMAGYSGTPLAQKLGIKPAMTVTVINEPNNYRQLLGEGAGGG